MDFSSGAYYIPDEFKNQVDFSYFCYDHFVGLNNNNNNNNNNSFFNFKDCGVLESIEKDKKFKKGKKNKKEKKFKV